MSKSTEELIQEFLDAGGEIEKLEPIELDQSKTIGSISKKTPQIMTLPEAELMFGKKQVKKKKPKQPDYSDINMDLIPDHLKKILKVDQAETTKETQVETNQNLGSTEASDKS